MFKFADRSYKNEQQCHNRRPDDEADTSECLNAEQVETPAVKETRVLAERLQFVFLSKQSHGNHAPGTTKTYKEKRLKKTLFFV